MLRKKEQIGIDIQKNILRYCMVRNGRWLFGEKLAKTTFLRENQLVNKRALEELLFDIFQELQVKNPRVVLAALNSKLLIRQVPLKEMEIEKEIREFLFFELGASIPLPFEDPIFDLLILNPPKKSKVKNKRAKGKTSSAPTKNIRTIERNRFAVNGNVPIIVTSEKLLEQVGESVNISGGHLAGVDFSALAYTKVLHHGINLGECFVLVEVNYGEATITIFEALVPVYMQYEVYNPGNWHFKEVDGEIEIGSLDEQSALKEFGVLIKNVITYFETEVSKNSKVAHVYVVGSHPKLIEDVYAMILVQTDLPTSVPQVPFLQDADTRMPHHYLLAASLALKGE